MISFGSTAWDFCRLACPHVTISLDGLCWVCPLIQDGRQKCWRGLPGKSPSSTSESENISMGVGREVFCLHTQISRWRRHGHVQKLFFGENLHFHAIFFLVLVTFNHYYYVKFKCEPTYVFISRLQSRIVHKKNEIALHGASELVSMRFVLSLLFNKV